MLWIKWDDALFQWLCTTFQENKPLKSYCNTKVIYIFFYNFYTFFNGNNTTKLSYGSELVFDNYRFSAFWLRSKCSICSYQLNIWYEGHRPSSILNWFLDGDRVSAACCGSITCWPCIAVPQGSAHFPTKYINSKINIHAFQWR